MWGQTRTPNLDPVIYSGGKILYDWLGWCMAYVRASFGTRSANTALEGWQSSKFRHEDRNLPSGIYVPIWFNHWGTYNGVYKNWGHVAIYKDGRVWTSPLTRKPYADVFNSIQEVESKYKASYIGWSEDVCGDRVIEFKGEDMGRIAELEAQVVSLNQALTNITTDRDSKAQQLSVKTGEVERLSKDFMDVKAQNVELSERLDKAAESLGKAHEEVSNIKNQLEITKGAVDELTKVISIKDGEIKRLEANQVEGSPWERLVQAIKDLLKGVQT